MAVSAAEILQEGSSSEEKVAKLVERSDHFTILIFGSLGTGKSSLINTILDKDVAVEGSKVEGGVTTHAEAHTGEKKEIKLLRTTTTINDIKISLWDTPGLRDPTAQEQAGIIEEIKAACSSDRIDLFLYSIDIRQARIRKNEFTAISKVTEALGVDIWENAIFTLNFANLFCATESDQGGDIQKAFDERVLQWKRGLRKAVSAAGVSEDVVSLIPIVPTSYRKEPLPCDVDWSKRFWSACIRQVRFISLPAVLRIKIPISIYTGQRLSGMADALEEKAIEERLRREGLKDVSGGWFIELVSKAATSATSVMTTLLPKGNIV